MKVLIPETRRLLQEARRAVCARGAVFLAVLPAAMVLAIAVFFPRDVALADWIHQDRSEFLRDVARRFSTHGDFRLPIEFFLFLVIAGVWKKRSDWRRLGLAILLAASFAGAVATTVRVATGRPRPSAHVADHFGGPEFRDHKRQSFPSAHAATSIATATVVLCGTGSVGVPFFLLSLGVPWARVYMHDHYLSDITVGGLVGIWFGLALGLPVRSRRRRNSACATV